MNNAVLRNLLSLVFTLALVVIAADPGAATTPTPSPLSACPPDFQIVYRWREGSLPPPYHYEYTIFVSPGYKGEITMIPDYAFRKPPTWTERFTVTQSEVSHIYESIVNMGLLSKNWRASSSPLVGGASCSLDIIARGHRVTVPVSQIPTFRDRA